MKEVNSMIKKAMRKIYKNRRLLFISFALILIVAISILGATRSAEIVESDDDLQVAPQSELIYYLNISYDGVDISSVQSSDSKTADVYSGIINVEDKLPEGLTFNGFEKGSDGTVGNAVNRSNGAACRGYVVDDSNGADANNNYRGLHYDDETRTVSFKIKSLEAGCKMTIGIKTITPKIDDPATSATETRRDFYNHATTREESLTVDSNTVHAWMSEDEEDEQPPLYSVTYKYDSSAPAGAPTPPAAENYAANTKVGVRGNVLVEGYEFLGWKIQSPTSVTIKDGSFTMPSQNVVLVGSFKAIPKHEVRYEIAGSVTEAQLNAAGYEKPDTQSYYPEDLVPLDSLKKGDEFNGYIFQGWTVQTPSGLTVDVKDNDFIMPDEDVVWVGKFEVKKYTVTYEFVGNILPTNHATLLPAVEQHAAGEKVKIKSITSPVGYEFSGWYSRYLTDSTDTITMPSENIVIQGEWRIVGGKFTPTITKTIPNKKDYYQPGDIVKYQITVTNPESYPLLNVTVSENNEKAHFVAGSNYSVESDHIVLIPTLGARASIVINAEYVVTTSDKGTIKNTVEIVGASPDSAHPNYELNQDANYTATASFETQSRVKICKNVTGATTNRTFQFKITGTGYETGIRLNNGDCQTIYVSPGSYKITEIIPQEYNLKSVTGSITTNGGTLTVAKNADYQITFTNEFRKKGFYHSFGEVVNKIKAALGH